MPTAIPQREPPVAHRGFTLVEILVVVVVLGILAAIIIPQVGGASQDAIKSALRRQIQTIDDIIEVYRVNNAGRLPTDDPAAPFGTDSGWGVLVSQNYMKSEPFNLYTGGSVVGPGTTREAAAATPQGHPVGWQYVATAERLDVYASGYDAVLNRLSNEP